MHTYVHTSSVHNNQDMETSSMSTDRWMDKEDVVHRDNGLLLSHKKNEIMPNATTWMQLEIIILSEINHKETNTMWCHLYVESKIWHNWTHLQNRNRLTDVETRLVVAKSRESGMDWEFGVGRCKLLHLEWINNEVLLYSSGNYIQSLGIEHDGR